MSGIVNYNSRKNRQEFWIEQQHINTLTDDIVHGKIKKDFN